MESGTVHNNDYRTYVLFVKGEKVIDHERNNPRRMRVRHGKIRPLVMNWGLVQW